jgi:vancomycin resistance protein YoaR
LIQTEINKETEELTYIFYGKKDGRQVTVSDVSLWDPRPAPEPRYQDDPTLKRGITKQVDWAASGIRSKFHYKSVRADGTIIQDRDFISNYRPWQAVYLVGTGE